MEMGAGKISPVSAPSYRMKEEGFCQILARPTSSLHSDLWANVTSSQNPFLIVLPKSFPPISLYFYIFS